MMMSSGWTTVGWVGREDAGNYRRFVLSCEHGWLCPVAEQLPVELDERMLGTAAGSCWAAKMDDDVQWLNNCRLSWKSGCWELPPVRVELRTWMIMSSGWTTAGWVGREDAGNYHRLLTFEDLVPSYTVTWLVMLCSSVKCQKSLSLDIAGSACISMSSSTTQSVPMCVCFILCNESLCWCRSNRHRLVTEINVCPEPKRLCLREIPLSASAVNHRLLTAGTADTLLTSDRQQVSSGTAF
jgi:hypothetical protein